MHESQLAGKQNEHSFNLLKYRVTDYVPGKMDCQSAPKQKVHQFGLESDINQGAHTTPGFGQ